MFFGLTKIVAGESTSILTTEKYNVLPKSDVNFGELRCKRNNPRHSLYFGAPLN